MSRLGDFLKHKRDDQSLSNEDLAKAAGIDESTIGQILSGDIVRPPDERLRGLARLLKVSFESLTNLLPQEAANSMTLDNTSSILTALNMAEGEGAAVPTELQLLPPGPLIRGRDGRKWVMENAQAVIDATVASGLDIPIDINHSTQRRASSGHESPAAGWIAANSLTVRNGSIYGTAQWNERGQQAVAAREYRYTSPAFLFDERHDRVHALRSLSLVNSPNLNLDSLNDQQETSAMTPELRTALNLSATATAADVFAAVAALNAKVAEHDAAVTALNAQVAEKDAALKLAENATPAAEKYVPIEQYQLVLTRATTAETTLNDQRQSAQETAINAAVDAAVEAGKIAPATRDFYLASCQQEGGLERFKTFIEAAPKVIADDSGLDNQTAENTTALNDSDAEVAQALGIEAADFAKSKTVKK